VSTAIGKTRLAATSPPIPTTAGHFQRPNSTTYSRVDPRALPWRVSSPRTPDSIARTTNAMATRWIAKSEAYACPNALYST